MSRSTRHVGVCLLGIWLLAVLQPETIRAQTGALPAVMPPADAPVKPPVSARLAPFLPTDPAVTRKFNAARDYLKAESWAEATHFLQSLLDSEDDALVSVKRMGKDGKEVTRWTGLHAEAARMLGALPPAGREFYELHYGRRARALFVEAQVKSDGLLLADVARRYSQTSIGAEALRLLGAYHLDRGRHTTAAVCFERVLERADADRVEPVTLFRAALAFRGASDAARLEQTWKRLAAKAPTGLRFGGKDVSLAELKKELDKLEASRAVRPEQAPEVARSLQAKWTRSTTHETITRSWLQSAVEQEEAHGQAILPASYPITAGEKVIYRSHRGVHAVDARSGNEAWEAPLSWSFDRMMPQPGYAPHVDSWVSAYLEVSPHVLFENAVVGTLSTDGARVYAVDDLAVPPYRHYYRSGGRWRPEPDWPDFGPGLTDAAYHSQLMALDAASGKPVWEIGGRNSEDEHHELSDTYFLGPPLALDGRLYVLAEKSSQLALCCLDPAGGGLLWKQALTFTPARLLLDPGRRIQAARPVYGDGILVCPTNAGFVFGLDLLTHGLVWVHPYRTEAYSLTVAPPSSWRGRGRLDPPRVVAEWKAPLTVVHGDRVLFAAPDEPSIRCLNVRDGSLLWKASKADEDLYLAGVFAGKVLVVGKLACRALDLADGKQLWQVETGLPSGQGVASGGVYYLPVKDKEPAIYATLTEAQKTELRLATGRDKQPAFCAIDLHKGDVLARTLAPAQELPGNLLFCNGVVFSQTATRVMAYLK